MQAGVSCSPDRTDGFDGFLGSNEQGIMLGLGNTTQPHLWVELEGMEGSAEVDVCSLMPSLLWLSNLCCFSSKALPEGKSYGQSHSLWGTSLAIGSVFLPTDKAWWT